MTDVPPDETSHSAEQKPSNLNRFYGGVIGFISNLPTALLLTGVLADRLGLIELVGQLVLKFRHASNWFWSKISALLPFDILLNPDLLSTYSLLIAPLFFKYIAKLKFMSKTSVPFAGWWYFTGLLSVIAIVTSFQTWSFIASLFTFSIGLYISVVVISLMSLPLHLFLFASLGIFEARILVMCIWLLLLIVWAFASALGFSLIEAIEGVDWLWEWLRNSVIGYLRFYTWDGIFSVLFGFITVALIFLAPLTRAPVWVVAWTVMFFSTDWFLRKVLPSIQLWLDQLGS